VVRGVRGGGGPIVDVDVVVLDLQLDTRVPDLIGVPQLSERGCRVIVFCQHNGGELNLEYLARPRRGHLFVESRRARTSHRRNPRRAYRQTVSRIPMKAASVARAIQDGIITADEL